MTINELILAIEEKHKNDDFKMLPPLTLEEIFDLEKFIGFDLPADFRTFYRICNGFEMNEDIFRMIPVELGSDLCEFLRRFLAGGVFDPGGLYDWHNEIIRERQ